MIMRRVFFESLVMAMGGRIESRARRARDEEKNMVKLVNLPA